MKVKTYYRVEWWENGRKRVKNFGTYAFAHAWAVSHIDGRVLVQQERIR